MEKKWQWLAIIPLLLLLLRKTSAWIARERAYSGKTAAQIFEEAGITIDSTSLLLLEDLDKYSTGDEQDADILLDVFGFKG